LSGGNRELRTENGDGSYTLALEDTPPPSSDMDFNDLVLRIRKNADGGVTVTVLSRNASFHFDLIDIRTDAVLIPLFERSGMSYTFPGGFSCSYGWNQEDPAYAINGRVLALDYFQYTAVGKPLPGGDRNDWNKQKSAWARPVPKFARHINMVNVLWSDGSASRCSPAYLRPTAASNYEMRWRGSKEGT
jgi:prepilin-type processing-associated H-X9-DG protein